MGSLPSLGSTGVYAYTTLISIFICAPGILLFERDVLAAAQQAAAAQGAGAFYGSLLSVGLLYHLYNQVRAVWDRDTHIGKGVYRGGWAVGCEPVLQVWMAKKWGVCCWIALWSPPPNCSINYSASATLGVAVGQVLPRRMPCGLGQALECVGCGNSNNRVQKYGGTREFEKCGPL